MTVPRVVRPSDARLTSRARSGVEPARKPAGPEGPVPERLRIFARSHTTRKVKGSWRNAATSEIRE